MKVFTIEDRNELSGLGLPNEEVVFTADKNGNPRQLYEIAEEIKNKTDSQNDCVIFCDIYLTVADKGFEWKQKNAGIALLQFLRIMNVSHHVVILSPDTEIQLIKENPDYLIIASKGTTITKQKYNFTGLTEERLKELANEKFDSDLKPFILSGFRLPEDERHNWANWWGIVQLTDTHRNVFPDEPLNFFNEDHKELSYPFAVTSKLKELRGQQAIYLYGHSPSDFIQATNELIVADFEKQIRVLNNSINFIEPRLTPSGKERFKPDHWADVRANYHKLAVANLSSGGASEFYEEEKKMDEVIAQKTTELKELKLKKEQIESTLNEIKNQKANRIIEVSGNENTISRIKNNRTSLASNSQKILYIDDQANEGWSDIFQILLYGKLDASRFLAIFDCSKDIDSIYKVIEEKIESFNPNLILLDLRLKKEAGSHFNIDELSGTQILQKVRTAYPGLPVMMTTASNKVWTYQELMKTGADAFWIKEGLDSRFNASDSINNYERFLWLISKLFDGKYRVLIDFAQFVSNIDFSKGWWNEYQKKARIKEIRIQHNSEELRKLLLEVVENIRMYLHYIHLEYGSLNEEKQVSESYHASSIINKLGNVVEIINDITEEDFIKREGAGGNVSEMINNRGDFQGNKIRSARNTASHREYTQNDWSKLELFIGKIKKYLSEPPSTISLLKG